MCSLKIKILIAAHKEYPMPEDDLYLPLMVGSALYRGELPGNFMRDDTGDNISVRNRNYCELTGLYWAWKNLKEPDYLGLCHYRRYFASAKRGRKQILSYEEASRLLSRYDVILPKARNYFIETNYSHYAHAHHAADLDHIRTIIAEQYPDYLESFDRSMSRTVGHRFNMFIMKRDLLDRYCSWLFDLLFELEKRLDITEYSERDKRVFGFVSERLLDVWLDANKIEYAEVPYLMTEKENLFAKGVGMISRKLKASLKQ